MGSNSSSINLDSWINDSSRSSLVSVMNEMAVASALWDLNDTADDIQDKVSYGHQTVQGVYTSDAFMDVAYGFFDDTCDFDTYMRGWVEQGELADGPTAAAVLQNAVIPIAGFAGGAAGPFAMEKSAPQPGQSQALDSHLSRTWASAEPGVLW
jgi:hypothetical protein